MFLKARKMLRICTLKLGLYFHYRTARRNANQRPLECHVDELMGKTLIPFYGSIFKIMSVNLCYKSVDSQLILQLLLWCSAACL